MEVVRREFIYLWYYATILLEQIFPYWLMGMVIGSVVSVFGKERIHRLFAGMQGKKWGVFGIIPACILGIASPLCMYGTIPIAASFMITGPATKITNLGAMKIVLGMRRFILYLLFVMSFSLLTGIMINLLIA